MQTLQTRWRNQRLLLGAAVLLLIAVGAIVVPWLGNFAETRRFAAIDIGMTEDKVLAILGPPGQYGPPGAKYCRGTSYC